MACPHVAGVLALGKAHRANATAAELLACLTSTATALDAAQDGGEEAVDYTGKLGAGLVNAVVMHAVSFFF
jgi:hypothetical protein